MAITELLGTTIRTPSCKSPGRTGLRTQGLDVSTNTALAAWPPLREMNLSQLCDSDQITLVVISLRIVEGIGQGLVIDLAFEITLAS